MNFKRQNLSNILEKIDKEGSGILFGNGFCSWLYEASSKVLQKRYQSNNWNIQVILKEASEKFITDYKKNINAIIIKDNNVDRIYSEILIQENKEFADKWLIYFLNRILRYSDRDRIKKSLNLFKLQKILKKVNLKFTTNYDPSFYWTVLKIRCNMIIEETQKWKAAKLSRLEIRNKRKQRASGVPELQDGFDLDTGCQILKYTESEKSTIFYLHGAIFLTNEKQLVNTTKISNKRSNKKFIEVCEEYLNSRLEIINNLPLLIVIGDNKYNEIQKNDYLKLALNKLLDCQQIITFGFSFKEDFYLLENIIKQCRNDEKTRNLYLGCYDFNDQSTNNPYVNLDLYFKQNLQPTNLNIIFYDSKDIDSLD